MAAGCHLGKLQRHRAVFPRQHGFLVCYIKTEYLHRVVLHTLQKHTCGRIYTFGEGTVVAGLRTHWPVAMV